MNIYIIRHGETDSNRNNLFQGKLDIPLNENGIKLAEITGSALKGIKFDICFSSPLKRASKTAEIILNESDNVNTEIKYDDRLKEINAGNWEGKSVNIKDKEISVLKLKLFKRNPFLVGKIGGAESAICVIKRTSLFLKEISKLDYENVLVSTHGFATRAMLNMFYKNKLDFWQGQVPLNCSINIVEVNNGKMTLIEKDKIYYDKSMAVDNFRDKK